MADDKAPVTIKSMDQAAWETAKRSAAKAGETMAEWLARAIRQLAALEEGDRETPPGQPSKPPAPGLPVAELEGLMRAAAALADASGVPVPKRTARHAYALVSAQLRAARGLSSGSTGRRIGQTRLIEAEPQDPR